MAVGGSDLGAVALDDLQSPLKKGVLSLLYTRQAVNWRAIAGLTEDLEQQVI